jgi:hypothetical protein
MSCPPTIGWVASLLQASAPTYLDEVRATVVYDDSARDGCHAGVSPVSTGGASDRVVAVGTAGREATTALLHLPH